jgi:hypothetical protein
MKKTTVLTRILAFVLVLCLSSAFFTTMPLVSFANETESGSANAPLADAPTGLTAIRTDENTVALSWDAVSGDGVTYNLYRQIYPKFKEGDTELLVSGCKTNSFVDFSAKDYLGVMAYRVSAVIDGKETAISTRVLEDSGVTAGFVDDSNALIQYEGNWKIYNKNTLYGSSMHYLSGADAQFGGSITLDFVGTGFELYTINSTNYGMLEVYIDDEFVGMADTYATAWVCGVKSFEIDGLPYGRHTLVLKAGQKSASSSGYEIQLEYLKILDSCVQPGTIDDTDPMIRYSEKWTLLS